jgi:hypothetical protein
MSMLNAHGVMPTSASAAGAGTAIGVSAGVSDLAATWLRSLGIALLVLTIVFAIGAVRSLLPRRAEIRARREAAGRGTEAP